MTVKNKSIKSYIDLISLKASRLLEKQNFRIILNDDIWDNNRLIVKSGGYLTDSLLNKLINFGIKKISVDFLDKAEKQDNNADLYKVFIKTQSVLIVEDNLLQISQLVKKFMGYGLDKSNIFVTDNPNSINTYFRNTMINFIFINLSLYEKCKKSVDKYSLLRNTHVFVLMEENESARKLKDGYNPEVRFLAGSLGAEKLKFFINQALSQNFMDFYTEETRIS